MKKKVLLAIVMVAMLICLFAVSASAAAYGADGEVTVRYFDSTVENLANKTDADAMFTSVWDANSIITSYNGAFPKTNAAGEAISWYKLGDAKQTDGDIYVAVASFVTMDENYYTLGSDGMYKFENGPLKTNIVSINFPNDAGVKSFSNGSHYGFFAQMGNYKPASSELLFAYFPNTWTEAFHLVQATPVLEVEFDKECALTKFYDASFYQCKSLRKVNIPKNVTQLGPLDDGNGSFRDCVSLTEVNFAEDGKLEIIGGHAFYGCDSFTEFTVPDTVKQIGQRAFQHCDNLVTIRYGASLESITGMSVSYLCHAARYIYISKTTTSISAHAFGTTQTGMGGKDMVFFYTGTAEDFAKITISANNERLSGATIVTYDATKGEQYYKDLATSESKCYVVCGFNMCDAFYGGIHAMKGDETVTVKSYFEDIVVGDTCTRNGCGKAVVSKTIGALFTYYGYSYTETAINGAYSMSQFFGVNKENVSSYAEATGRTIEYGLVASASENPLSYGENGLEYGEKTMVVPQNKFNHAVVDIKISGITDGSTDNASDLTGNKIIFCVYVVDNGTVYYLSNGTSSENATGISYDEVVDLENIQA